jgi:ArsR family transcriptional regulator, arsenate/arsenite/antimonite-responsive transcriptional repressor
MKRPRSLHPKPRASTRPATEIGAAACADAALAAFAKALAHPARVAIFRLLTKRGECICGQIVDVLPLAQATVSQHLKVLKDAGLIQGEVDGPRVCYCADPKAIARFRELLEGL